MEESVSGFEVQGEWDTVVEHGERITKALDEADVEEEMFREWDEWRPKSDERLDEEMDEKTAEQASVGEGTGEQADVSPDEDLQTAGEDAVGSSNKIEEGDTEDAIERGKESFDHAARAADTAGRKAIRSVEESIYRNVMTQVSPQYFDNELISANIDEAGDDESYVFEVNISDEDIKAEVREQLDEDDTEGTTE